MAPPWISLEEVSQGASTACSVFGFWIEVIGPCFILSYDPVAKIRFILVARQKISWNVKPGQFLVVSYVSWDPSSGNILHTIDSQNCLNWTIAYTHFPGNASQVSPFVAHDQIVHSFGSFIVGGLFWSPRPLIISNALPTPLKFSSPYFHSAIGRGLLKCIHEVIMDFILYFQISSKFKMKIIMKTHSLDLKI
jgi:hypothetical protein